TSIPALLQLLRRRAQHKGGQPRRINVFLQRLLKIASRQLFVVMRHNVTQVERQAIRAAIQPIAADRVNTLPLEGYLAQPNRFCQMELLFRNRFRAQSIEYLQRYASRLGSLARVRAE